MATGLKLDLSEEANQMGALVVRWDFWLKGWTLHPAPIKISSKIWIYILPSKFANFFSDLFYAPYWSHNFMLAFNSKLAQKYEKLSAMARVINTQSLVISPCRCAVNGKNVQRFITHVHSHYFSTVWWCFGFLRSASGCSNTCSSSLHLKLSAY